MSLAATLRLGSRELIALVGGGGKSTMLFALGSELAQSGEHVILTTTTKMGRHQIGAVETVCWSADPGCLAAATRGGGPVMLVTGGDDHKVTGPPPETIDALFATSVADYLIVEADGSHGKPLKAPASHEPVIPAASTLVVILMGIDAVGQPLERVVHRVAVAQRFVERGPDHRLSPEDCATILLHREGILQSCPEDARVAIAITKIASDADAAAAAEIAAITAIRFPEILTVMIGSDGD